VPNKITDRLQILTAEQDPTGSLFLDRVYNIPLDIASLTYSPEISPTRTFLSPPSTFPQAVKANI